MKNSFEKNSLEKYLEAPDGAGKLLAHARQLIKLAQIYQEIAPSYLAEHSCVANYKNDKTGTVVIHAVSGAVATKLRQMAPTLSDKFSQKGFACCDVQIKVQAYKVNKPIMVHAPKPLSKAASNELENLRDSLPESPLRAALQNLLTHALKAP